MKMFRIAALGLAVAAGAGVAYAQMNHGAHGGHGGTAGMDSMQEMMRSMMPAAGDSDAVKAFKQADLEMMKGMSVAYTGNPDVDFRLKMIPHHQGAIDMAKAALRYGQDAGTKALAEQIIAAQDREIADMKAWLERNRK